MFTGPIAFTEAIYDKLRECNDDSGDETASDGEEADGADADAEDEEVCKPAEDNEELARGTSPGQGA